MVDSRACEQAGWHLITTRHSHAECPVETNQPTWKVDASFYVQAETARDAERLVTNELNSPPIQKLIGDTVGDVDVHEGDTVAWNMEG